MKDWAAIKKAIADVRKLREEQEKCFRELELCCEVAERGVNPEEVQAYYWDDRAPECQRWISKKYETPYLVDGMVRSGRWPAWLVGPHYNRARMKNGEVAVLDPPVRRP